MESGDNTELTKISLRDRHYIDPTGCHHESLPQFFHELVAPTQMKCIYQARNFRQHWQLRIHICGRSWNQVFQDWIISVPDYKGGKHNLLSLSLMFVFGEHVAVEIQHPTTRCLKVKPLIASEKAVSLKMSDYLVYSMSKDQHILPTHTLQ